MGIIMSEGIGNAPAGDGNLLRLLHLVSPSLPIGAFAYSQGLEWAVEAGWVTDGNSLRTWLAELLRHGVRRVDVPVLVRAYEACNAGDEKKLAYWCSLLLACRETHELRQEERNKGRALALLLAGLGMDPGPPLSDIISQSQLGGFAYAAARWRIRLDDAARGYVWSWLENQVLAGVKLIPIGQTEGQRVLHFLHGHIVRAVEDGLRLADEEIGSSLPALAIGSSCHETQYTRLFRS